MLDIQSTILKATQAKISKLKKQQVSVLYEGLLCYKCNTIELDEVL